MKEIEKILGEIRPEVNFEESENFLEDGLIDSFDLITLVASLDESFGISIKGTDIVPENFSNIANIEKMLNNYGVKS